MTVSFRTSIAPIFSQFQGQMMWRFDLTDYDHVKANAQSIHDRISDPSFPMPPPPLAPLAPAEIRLFEAWMQEGCPP